MGTPRAGRSSHREAMLTISTIATKLARQQIRSRCPAAELRRTGSPAPRTPPRDGMFAAARAEAGLRFDIEVSGIGPDRHDEVVQEALEPPKPNGCGATRTTSSPLTRPPARDLAPSWL